jgi:hypothetical protein
MTYKQTSFSAKESEYVSARKLTREECAAAYHVPLPMVGILDHATFSNIKEQHKHLYQDCLGPWLTMISQEIERQLLPETSETRDVYIEFNIAEKMKGSFEEQASSLQALTGRPLMTGNEGRARLNLPRIDDPSMDEVAPQQGGPAAATEPQERPSAPATDEEEASTIARVVQSSRARQMARLSKLDAAERPGAFLAGLDRWNRELASDLTPVLGEVRAESCAIVANAKLLTELKAEAEDA